MSTTRRVDIGVASYRNPDKLRKTLESIEAMSHTDWRCFIVHNDSSDDADLAASKVMQQAARSNQRFVPFWMHANLGYAGAVNKLFELAETPYVLYLDNDVEILTPGWDERFCQILDRFPEVGQVFPGAGHYGFHNGRYHECLWNAGYAWALRYEAADRVATDIVGHRLSGGIAPVMDPTLGHHEEVDLMIRLRLAGYQIACDPGVNVLHHESSTQSPESAKRIHAGVVRWMNKWNKYFCGDALRYPNPDPNSGEGYDPRALRYTDWPPCALYLERWALAQFPKLNATPEVIQTSAGPMDAIKVLKPTNCYRERAI
jgi:GT2 family glycosyltransferase